MAQTPPPSTPTLFRLLRVFLPRTTPQAHPNAEWTPNTHSHSYLRMWMLCPELGQKSSPSFGPGSEASWLLKQGGLRRPLSTGEETRKGRAHSLRKHVFSVYREACPVPMLCSLIWSQKKKKNQMCSFLSEVLLEAAGKSGLLQARRAGPRAGRGWGLCPTRCQCPASRGLHIPTQKALWKTKCPSAPPRKGVHGDDGGRQPWCS